MRKETIVNSGNIPEEITRWKQWICWNYEEIEGRLQKRPKNAKTGKSASWKWPNTFSSFDEVLRKRHLFDGIGFCLTCEDPFACADFDDCFDETGKAVGIFAELTDVTTYIERTPSKKGAHIWFKSQPFKTRRIKSQKIELYFSGQYITFTGDKIGEFATIQTFDTNNLWIIQNSEPLISVCESDSQQFIKPVELSKSLAGLIRVICEKDGASFGHGGEFAKRWSGDYSLDFGDESATDFNVAQTIDRWLWKDNKDNDSKRYRLIREAMLGSKLVRNRWFLKEAAYFDWLERTIVQAMEATKAYQESRGL